MAEKNPKGEQSAPHMLPVNIQKQYIRDLSFENIAAPESFLLKEAPEMDIEADIQARRIENVDFKFLYEVVLLLRVSTGTKDTPVFVLELTYATLVSIGEEVPEDQHHAILFIEIPRFSFPYANQIVSSVSQNGGFPPLYLQPIDFHSLYMERFKDEIEAAKKEAEGKASS